MPSLQYLKPIKKITLAKTGKQIIADADDVFKYIDSDFIDWNANEKSVPQKETKVAVLEMTKDATLEQMFNKDTDCLTQAQIIEFCKNHKDDLRQDGYATFFLFKSNDQYFVAFVFVISGGLNVYVRRLERVHVWRGSDARRIVVPQLALDTLEPSPSEPLTLEQAIKIVKENGFKVIKEY